MVSAVRCVTACYDDDYGDDGSSGPDCRGERCGFGNPWAPGNPNDPSTGPSGGPDGGGAGGGVPTCDAACRFRIYLDYLNLLSDQGRGNQQPGSSTVADGSDDPGAGPLSRRRTTVSSSFRLQTCCRTRRTGAVVSAMPQGHQVIVGLPMANSMAAYERMVNKWLKAGQRVYYCAWLTHSSDDPLDAVVHMYAVCGGGSAINRSRQVVGP